MRALREIGAIPELAWPAQKVMRVRPAPKAIPAFRGFRASRVLLERRAILAIVDPKVRWVRPGRKAKPGPRVLEAPMGPQVRLAFKVRRGRPAHRGWQAPRAIRDRKATPARKG